MNDVAQLWTRDIMDEWFLAGEIVVWNRLNGIDYRECINGEQFEHYLKHFWTPFSIHWFIEIGLNYTKKSPLYTYSYYISVRMCMFYDSRLCAHFSFLCFIQRHRRRRAVLFVYIAPRPAAGAHWLRGPSDRMDGACETREWRAGHGRRFRTRGLQANTRRRNL